MKFLDLCKVYITVDVDTGAVCVNRSVRLPNGWLPGFGAPLGFNIRICMDWAYEAVRLVERGIVDNRCESNILLAEIRFDQV